MGGIAATVTGSKNDYHHQLLFQSGTENPGGFHRGFKTQAAMLARRGFVIYSEDPVHDARVSPIDIPTCGAAVTS